MSSLVHKASFWSMPHWRKASFHNTEKNEELAPPYVGLPGTIIDTKIWIACLRNDDRYHRLKTPFLQGLAFNGQAIKTREGKAGWKIRPRKWRPRRRGRCQGAFTDTSRRHTRNGANLGPWELLEFHWPLSVVAIMEGAWAEWKHRGSCSCPTAPPGHPLHLATGPLFCQKLNTFLLRC